MASKATRRWFIAGGIFLVLGLPVLWIVFLGKLEFHAKSLPYYGPKVPMGGKDTQYHQVGPFVFTDHNGKLITESEFDSCVYIANIFFIISPRVFLISGFYSPAEIAEGNCMDTPRPSGRPNLQSLNHP